MMGIHTVCALILFLLVFSGLAFARTNISKTITQDTQEEKANRMIAAFLAATGIILAIAFFLILTSLCSTAASFFAPYGMALVFAVGLSLWFGGRPEIPPHQTKPKYRPPQ